MAAGNARRLAGKVAVITGASRGLGQYCAIGYGREDARVVVAARTETMTDPRLPGTIHETARLIEEAGGEALPVSCNVADLQSIEKMVETVLKHYGRIDILMTNAAVQPTGGIATMKPKSFELEFNINVFGTFRTIRAALPAMQAQKSGNIINISSVAAERGSSHYGATKLAVEAITRSLASELKDEGIAVNALKPVTGIETPGMLFGRAQGRPARPDLPKPDSYVEAAILLAMQTPNTCTGQVANDAQLIERLASTEVKAKFRKENPEPWVKAMTA
jgi:NAD(P)-dependent dehydrogenase (short-subunit alcohol dehydrogenase family)